MSSVKRVAPYFARCNGPSISVCKRSRVLVRRVDVKRAGRQTGHRETADRGDEHDEILKPQCLFRVGIGCVAKALGREQFVGNVVAGPLAGVGQLGASAAR